MTCFWTGSLLEGYRDVLYDQSIMLEWRLTGWRIYLRKRSEVRGDVEVGVCALTLGSS